jgi:hypothetical protein
MGVDEGVPIRVMLVAHRLNRVVGVRVRCGRQSEEEWQHRKRRTKTAQHDSSIVSAAYGPCQANRAGAPRYNADMNTMRRFTVTLVAAAVVAGLAPLSAHEVTHNGTVVALKTAKYAQPSGGSREVRELEVAVVDPKTKKVANRVFTITDKTKITRAGKPVANADVTAQKDEKVAVVVDHDKPGDEAIHVRFQAAK